MNRSDFSFIATSLPRPIVPFLQGSFPGVYHCCLVHRVDRWQWSLVQPLHGLVGLWGPEKASHLSKIIHLVVAEPRLEICSSDCWLRVSGKVYCAYPLHHSFHLQCPFISELSLSYGPVSLIIRRLWNNCARNQKKWVLLVLLSLCQRHPSSQEWYCRMRNGWTSSVSLLCIT